MTSATPAPAELRGDAASRKRASKASPSRVRSRERRRAIVCRRCAVELSDASAVFSMTPAGSSGVFVNPHGILHEVITVRRAKNLVVTGPATTEFTWFPGYAWEIAWCAGCATHVGWSFAATADEEPRAFWGLRRNAIAEE